MDLYNIITYYNIWPNILYILQNSILLITIKIATESYSRHVKNKLNFKRLIICKKKSELIF